MSADESTGTEIGELSEYFYVCNRCGFRHAKDVDYCMDCGSEYLTKTHRSDLDVPTEDKTLSDRFIETWGLYTANMTPRQMLILGMLLFNLMIATVFFVGGQFLPNSIEFIIGILFMLQLFLIYIIGKIREKG